MLTVNKAISDHYGRGTVIVEQKFIGRLKLIKQGWVIKLTLFFIKNNILMHNILRLLCNHPDIKWSYCTH